MKLQKRNAEPEGYYMVRTVRQVMHIMKLYDTLKRQRDELWLAVEDGQDVELLVELQRNEWTELVSTMEEEDR